MVEEIFGQGTFQWIQGQTEDMPRKPDPTAVWMITEKLGVKPSETLYIGDSEVDVATGKAAQIQTAAVTWGFRGRKKLEEAGAGLIVDSPEEIMKLIKD